MEDKIIECAKTLESLKEAYNSLQDPPVKVSMNLTFHSVNLNRKTDSSSQPRSIEVILTDGGILLETLEDEIVQQINSTRAELLDCFKQYAKEYKGYIGISEE